MEKKEVTTIIEELEEDKKMLEKELFLLHPGFISFGLKDNENYLQTCLRIILDTLEIHKKAESGKPFNFMEKLKWNYRTFTDSFKLNWYYKKLGTNRPEKDFNEYFETIINYRIVLVERGISVDAEIYSIN